MLHISNCVDCDVKGKKTPSPSSSPRPKSSHRSRSGLSVSQSVDSVSPRDKSGAAEYKSPGHSASDRDSKVSEFKNKSKATFSKTVDTSSTPMEEWKEANLQRMTSKELVDHLEGLRNTVKRLQQTECKFKPVDEEEVSCG